MYIGMKNCYLFRKMKSRVLIPWFLLSHRSIVLGVSMMVLVCVVIDMSLRFTLLSCLRGEELQCAWCMYNVGFTARSKYV